MFALARAFLRIMLTAVLLDTFLTKDARSHRAASASHPDLCDLHLWYLDRVTDGVFDGDLSEDQQRIKKRIESLIARSRGTPDAGRIACSTLHTFEHILLPGGGEKEAAVDGGTGGRGRHTRPVNTQQQTRLTDKTPDDHKHSGEKVDEHRRSTGKNDDHKQSGERVDEHRRSTDKTDDHEHSGKKPDEHRRLTDKPDDNKHSGEKFDEVKRSTDKRDEHKHSVEKNADYTHSTGKTDNHKHSGEKIGQDTLSADKADIRSEKPVSNKNSDKSDEDSNANINAGTEETSVPATSNIESSKDLSGPGSTKSSPDGSHGDRKDDGRKNDNEETHADTGLSKRRKHRMRVSFWASVCHKSKKKCYNSDHLFPPLDSTSNLVKHYAHNSNLRSRCLDMTKAHHNGRKSDRGYTSEAHCSYFRIMNVHKKAQSKKKAVSSLIHKSCKKRRKCSLTCFYVTTTHACVNNYDTALGSSQVMQMSDQKGNEESVNKESSQDCGTEKNGIHKPCGNVSTESHVTESERVLAEVHDKGHNTTSTESEATKLGHIAKEYDETNSRSTESDNDDRKSRSTETESMVTETERGNAKSRSIETELDDDSTEADYGGTESKRTDTVSKTTERDFDETEPRQRSTGNDDTDPQSDDKDPQSDDTDPQSDDTDPQSDDTDPQSNDKDPQSDDTDAQNDDPDPQSGETESAGTESDDTDINGNEGTEVDDEEAKKTDTESRDPESHDPESHGPESHNTESDDTQSHDPESNDTESTSDGTEFGSTETETDDTGLRSTETASDVTERKDIELESELRSDDINSNETEAMTTETESKPRSSGKESSHAEPTGAETGPGEVKSRKTAKQESNDVRPINTGRESEKTDQSKDLTRESEQIISTDDFTDKNKKTSRTKADKTTKSRDAEETTKEDESSPHVEKDSTGVQFSRDELLQIEARLKENSAKQAARMQSLEILVMRLENQVLTQKLSEQNESTQIVQLENQVLRIQNELLRLNHSYSALHEENELLKSRQRKYLALEHKSSQRDKAFPPLPSNTTKYFELVKVQQEKISALNALLSNQSSAVERLQTRSERLEEQNQALYQIVMNQTALLSHVMQKLQEVADDNLKNRQETNQLKSAMDLQSASTTILHRLENMLHEASPRVGGPQSAGSSGRRWDEASPESPSSSSSFLQLLRTIGYSPVLSEDKKMCEGKERPRFCLMNSVLLSPCPPYSAVSWNKCKPGVGDVGSRGSNGPLSQVSDSKRSDISERQGTVLTTSSPKPGLKEDTGRQSASAADKGKGDEVESHPEIPAPAEFQPPPLAIHEDKSEPKLQKEDPEAPDSVAIPGFDSKAGARSEEGKSATAGYVSKSRTDKRVSGKTLPTVVEANDNQAPGSDGKSPETKDDAGNGSESGDGKVDKKEVESEPDDKSPEREGLGKDEGSQEKLPVSSGKEKLPVSSGKEKLPVSSGKEKLPVSSNKEKLPDSSGKEKLPVSSGKEKLPVSSNKEKLPVSSGKEKLPVSSGKVLPDVVDAVDGQEETYAEKADKRQQARAEKAAQELVSDNEKKTTLPGGKTPPAGGHSQDGRSEEVEKERRRAEEEGRRALEAEKLAARKREQERLEAELLARKVKDAETRSSAYFSEDDRKPKDCYDLYTRGQTRNGAYKIFVKGLGLFVSVYCDMRAGGWTLVMKRDDGELDFYRGWDDYTEGFGAPHREHYIGNEVVHYLTNQGRYSLQVDLRDWTGQERTATYTHFWVDDERHEFRLHVLGYSGNAGDGLGKHDGMAFSTKDHDNDLLASDKLGGSCARRFHGAGWYYKCYMSNLMGMHYVDGVVPEKRFDGVAWKPWTGPSYSLKEVVLKVRPWQAN